MAFTLLFVVVLTVGVLTRLWLAGRQIRHVARHRHAVPAVFSHRISLTSHQRAADYTVARVRLGMVETVVDAAVLICLTLLGGLQWLAEASYAVPGGDIVRQLVFIAAVMAIISLVNLPFTLWRQFRLEARFGFNRMTFRLFLADALKGLLVGAVLGLPLVAVILWLMQSAGDAWWFWAWIVWAVFNLAVLWLFPTVIAPLFNKFSPLTDTDLTARIHALANRCGFSLNGLFVMHGSKRSPHGNAYFPGFGKAQRIVFFDTLPSRLNARDTEAVLGHEL